MKKRGVKAAFFALLLAAVAIFFLLNRQVYRKNGVTLDLSLRDTGRVTVSAENDRRLKLRLTLEGGEEYTYDLPGDGTQVVFPLSQGPGSYRAEVFANIEGNRYGSLASQDFQASFDPAAPFLYPSRMVSYTGDSAAVRAAETCVAGLAGDAERTAAVLTFVTETLTYDQEKAGWVGSGYLPDPDAALAAGKGICQDYAALMAAMLRSLGIPCQMAVGWLSSGEYHAWVRVWSEEGGPLPGWDLELRAGEWTVLDPTFLSQDPGLADFVADESHYPARYVY